MTAQEVPAQHWGDAMMAPQPPARRRTRRLVIGLCVAFVVAAGAIYFLLAVVAPYAGAAGGCGGG